MDFSNFVGKKVEYAGVYGVVKDFNEMFNSIKIRFDNQKTQGFTADDYNFDMDNNGVVHVKEKVEFIASGTKILAPVLDRVPPSKDNRIYHSTCLNNFLSMVKCGALCSRYWLGKNKIDFKDVSVLTPKRELLNIHKRIPFHFLPKNPFDYSVFGKKVNQIPYSNMVVIAIDRFKFNDCSYVYPCLPTAIQWKLPHYKDSNKEWTHVEMANGEKGFRPQRYDCTNDEWMKLPFWGVLDRNYSSGPNVICNDQRIRQTLLAEYNIDKEKIQLSEIVQVFVPDHNAYEKITSEDEKEILKGKIIVGDWKYLL